MRPVIIEKFNEQQLETIIGHVATIIAEPEDREFVRGILFARADASKSAPEFAAFAAKLLKVLR